MTTYQEILDDLKSSMLEKNELKTSTLRMLKADLMKLEKESSDSQLNEESILKVVLKSVKQRKDSVDQFIKGNRPELAEREEKEIEILKKYMPQQLTEDEIRKLVQVVISGLGVSDKSGIGQVMSVVMSKLKGQADGSLVKNIVSEELS